LFSPEEGGRVAADAQGGSRLLDKTWHELSGTFSGTYPGPNCLGQYYYTTEQMG